MEVKHGSNRGWLAGCRERCCIRAHRRYNKKTLGRVKRRVPVEQVQGVLQDLFENRGHTYSTVSRITGLDQSTLFKWYGNKRRFVRIESYNKLLKAREYRPNHQFTYDATGACRRLQGMALRGFGLRRVSQMTGVSSGSLAQIRSGNTKRVRIEVHETIRRALIESLHLDPPKGPKADLTRRQAMEKGYLPFGVWDDIDDPNCVADDPNPEFSDPDLQDAVQRARNLACRGFMVTRIADASGIPRPNMHKILMGVRKKVRPETVKKINLGCDKLEPLPDPEGPRADAARTIAAKNKW